MRIEPERLAYWYLRLNGFLTVSNFLIHPETKRDNSTEVDILGVRFPFRAENLTRPMVDDELFTRHGDRLCMVITEVKNGLCDLNGPWRNPETRSMEKVLAAMGLFPESSWQDVADSLYRSGCFQDDKHYLSLLCVGRHTSEQLCHSFSEVPQVTFEHALRFIHGRVSKYVNEKAQHEQWDSDGKALWDAVAGHPKIDEFLKAVRVEIG